MKKSPDMLDLTFQRTLATTPSAAYKAWLDKTTPGTTWHEHDKLILNAKLGGFFYWLTNNTAHYGRFIKMQPGKMMQYTWMSRYTSGEESVVTVTFKKKGDETVMTLNHTGLPNDAKSKEHEGGWNYFLDKLTENFAKKAKRKK